MFSLSQKAFFVAMIVASTLFDTDTAVAKVATHAMPSPDSCLAAEKLFADDTLRHPGRDSGESACYRLEIHEEGWLHLAVLGADNVRLDLSAPRGLEVLGRTASEFLVGVRPGVYTVRVYADDPSQPLPSHRVSSRLWLAGKSEENGELELEPEKSEENGELELEPEKTTSLPSPFACGRASKSEENGELELEPEKSETCSAVRKLLERLCSGPGDDDDHSDSLACASPIASPADAAIAGSIQNAWGDDADIFRFELSTWQTIKVQADGELTPNLTLLDGRGHALGAAEGRLVRTLGPGHYFLRLDAAYETGNYQLSVETLDR